MGKKLGQVNEQSIHWCKEWLLLITKGHGFMHMHYVSSMCVQTGDFSSLWNSLGGGIV